MRAALGDGEKTKKYREALSNFYSVIKGLVSENYIHFWFITGISKFSYNPFSYALGNCEDITRSAEYLALCGFTRSELQPLFDKYLPEILKKQIYIGHLPQSTTIEQFEVMVAAYYGGYSWDGITKAFNPFSILNFFKTHELRPFCPMSVDPRLILKKIKNNLALFFHEDSYDASDVALCEPLDGNIHLISLLFQAGFLTVSQKTGPSLFILKEQNQETRQSLNNAVIRDLIGKNDLEISRLRAQIDSALIDLKEESLSDRFSQILNWIPSSIHAPLELYFQSLIVAFLKVLNYKIRAATSESRARIELSLQTPSDAHCVIEFEFAKIALENDGADDPENLNPKPARAKSEEIMGKALNDATSRINAYTRDDTVNFAFAAERKIAVGVVGRVAKVKIIERGERETNNQSNGVSHAS